MAKDTQLGIRSRRVRKSRGFGIALVQRFLQHRSTATTQSYIGIEPQKIE